MQNRFERYGKPKQSCLSRVSEILFYVLLYALSAIFIVSGLLSALAS